MSTIEDSGYAPRKESLAGFGPTNTMAGFTGAKGLTGFDMTTNEPRRDERQRDTWLEATRPYYDKTGGGGGVGNFGPHPFKVINATDGDGPKVRVLPGACNFTFPTVSGATNEYWTPLDHLNSAPRIDVSGFTAVCFVVIALSPGASGSIFPVTDIVAKSSLSSSDVPVAVVTLSSGSPKRITGIRQMLYDFVGVTVLNYADGVQYAITR